MNSKRFYARLAEELPEWVTRGWVEPGNGQAILDYVASRHKATPWLTYAFSILGVLLLGSGIITYFAANWGEIPKLLKLFILFGSMWLAYGAAWHALRGQYAPLLGQALLLLGTILFGANIMLIAQMYHIDSHFPNGVLLWSLGALLGAYLVRSQPLLMAAIVLAGLWTSLELGSFWYRHAIHWPFLILWVAFLPLIYKYRFRPALQVAMIALLLWSLYSFVSDSLFWESSDKLYLVQVFFLGYLAIFILGMLFTTYERLEPFARIVQRYSLFTVLVCAYALTSPAIQSRIIWLYNFAKNPSRQPAGTGFLVVTLLALAIVVALALWHRARTGKVNPPAYLKWGQGLILAIMVLLLVNLFLAGASGSLVAIAFNLLLFAGLLWLIYAGMHSDDRFMVNIGFVFFGLTLLTRYFDTFWSLLNRSYFFMIGGLILIAGGYFLERKRRQLTHKIGVRREGGGI